MKIPLEFPKIIFLIFTLLFSSCEEGTNGGIKEINSIHPLQKLKFSHESFIESVNDSNKSILFGDILIYKDKIISFYCEFPDKVGDFQPTQICSNISDNEGKTWKEKEVIIGNKGKSNLGAPNLLQLENGKILFIYYKKYTYDRTDILAKFSSDTCKTWTNSIIINKNEKYYTINNGRAIITENNRIIIPVAYRDNYEDGKPFRSTCFYSDDYGVTWKESTNSVTSPMRGAMEPGIVELSSGNLLMIIRTQTGRVWFSRSNNNGKSWEKPYETSLESPESPSTIFSHNNILYLIHNPNYNANIFHYGERTPLQCSVSYDFGASWQDFSLIEENINYYYDYASVKVFRDKIYLLFNFKRKSKKQFKIKFKVYNIHKIHLLKK